MRYDFNGYAVPYARSVRVQRRRRATCCGPRSRTPTWPVPGPRLPSPRSGEPRSTAIGGAARATRGCLAPRTHKYPDAVLSDFRTTPWLVLARFHALDSYTHHCRRSRGVSRYLVRPNFVRVRGRSPRTRIGRGSCGREGETFAIAVHQVRYFSERIFERGERKRVASSHA